MEINGEAVCDTLERADTLIEAGDYEAVLDLSPHLGYVCPHLRVPDRDKAAGGDAGIRIHIANYAKQLEGCIAIGTKDGNADDYSEATFNKMMALLPPSFTVSISF